MSKNTLKQNIPSGWQEKSLGKLLAISKGKLPKETYQVADENSVPYLSIRHLDGVEFKYANKNDGVIANKNDLLVIADGSGSGRMYRGYYGLVSSTFLKISSQSPSEVSNDYLEALFSHLDFTKLRFRKGGAIPHFDFKQLKDVDIFLPPIKEQQKISEILGAVDENIAKTQEVIDATEKLKVGLMRQLFTRGIGHTKFKETKIGQIPEGWETVQLSDVTELITKGTTPTTYGHAFVGEGVNFFKIENIDGNGNIDLTSCKHISTETHGFLKRSQLSTGDILFSIAGALGRIAIINNDHLPANVNQAIAIIRLKDTDTAKFVAMALITDHIKGQTLNKAVQMAQANVSLGQLSQMLIPWPSKNEQKEIAEILSAVDEKISVNKKLKEKLTLLKKGLMQDLLSGNKRV